MLLSLNSKSLTLRFHAFARLLCVVAIFSFTYCGGPQDATAQFDGGDIGINGGGDAGISDLNSLSNNGGNLGTGSGGTSDSGTFGENIGNVLENADTTDLRNQGFVGSTGTRIQELGFVGPPGETSAAQLAEGASFGGGINDVTLGSNGGGGGGANTRNGNNGFGGTGEVKGFEVFRSSVRANLRPRFSYPQANGNKAAYRFQNRIRRLPEMGNDGAGVQISISNRTATIQGFVGSAEESKRIERQLRLEPGVYKINNYATVAGQ